MNTIYKALFSTDTCFNVNPYPHCFQSLPSYNTM